MDPVIHKFDYLVLGSGIAGLTAARRLSQDGSVAVLTKSAVREGSTTWAQGGIAVAMNPGDAPKFHFEDTLKAGDGLCDESAVKILVSEGPERVRQLIELGADFDKYGDDFSFTKEGAHSKRRILHAGDATGREIEKTLGNTIASEKKAVFFASTNVLRLITHERRCIGCIAVQGAQPVIFLAKAVVLATGGCGQVYSHNTNPPVATGDGIALAYDIGAAVQDMEFVQFHPTTLYTGDKKPISIFLISEAVRGEGAVLRNLNGDRFMPDYNPAAELAPRDVVSRAIYHEMKKSGAQHVYLDLSHLDMDIAKRFPTIYDRCLRAGVDITRDFIPVAPAAHYFMGGIQTDLVGQTTIPGLYACGEVASLGLHGANRLASNSLLDGLVFGHRAAEAAISDQSPMPEDRVIGALPPTDISRSAPVSMARVGAIKQSIRELMWQKAGIIRTAEDLNQAQNQLADFKAEMASSRLIPKIQEVQNMIVVAELIVQFALTRTESRGSHYREDYPEKEADWSRHQVNRKRGLNTHINESVVK